MRHVIVGNGPAGVIAAETLRDADPESSIVLIGDESEPPYSRMAIPYLLSGNIQEGGIYLRKNKDHFARQGIELMTARARRLDSARASVHLSDGKQLEFDRLLIATGARPAAPPIPGIDLPGVHPCWTLEDARQLMKLARPKARVLQMGAGFIGCIVLEALASRGVELTVVEMGNRMVPRMMTEAAGALIKKWCEKRGVRVFTSTRVESIAPSREPGVLRASLSNGEALEAELVISATGVRPNIAFLKDSGVKTDLGVLVDARMQSSVPGIYAAGDVAQSAELGSGASVVNAIQPNAADQARVAALNMAGRKTQSQGALAMNVLDTLGLISSSFGQWMGVAGGEHAELLDEDAFKYLRLEFQDDILVGATSIGLTQHVGVLRGLIQGKVRLGAWKERLIEDPTRIMEAYLARAQGAAVHSF